MPGYNPAWPSDVKAAAFTMWRDGAKDADIAAAIGRSTYAVQSWRIQNSLASNSKAGAGGGNASFEYGRGRTKPGKRCPISPRNGWERALIDAAVAKGNAEGAMLAMMRLRGVPL